MEIRVHGIGGPAAESTLGCDRTTVESRRSQPSARSSFRRCPGNFGSHAYHWSPLTSGSRTFALWPLLLPFTLANIAGWMAPPYRSGRRIAVYRAAAVTFGLTMTAAVVVWADIAGWAIWRRVGKLPGWVPGDSREHHFWLGVATAALVLLVLVLAATYTAAGYERFRPESWGPANASRWRLAQPWGAGVSKRLDDPRFFDNGGEHRFRWRVHVVVAALTWSAMVAWALTAKGGARDPSRAFGDATVAVGALQALAVGLMAIACLFPNRLDHRPLDWRLLGPATATIASMLLGGLAISTIAAVASFEALPRGRAIILYDAYGWSIYAAVLMAVGCACYCLASPSEPERSGTRARLLPTLAARLRGRLARFLAYVASIVCAVGLTFAALAFVFTVARWSAAGDAHGGWRLSATPPVELARWSFAVVLAVLFLNVVKSRGNPRVLRRIGNIWDIITFWPRTYHPLAVRPYAERAVPELQDAVGGAFGDGPVVLAAHSQGAVLAYAVARSLPPTAGTARGRIGLVTFGSPLQSLYAQAFPHYVDLNEVRETRAALGERWTNLFRFTDHVGRAVFTSDQQAAQSAPAAAGDVPLPDPDQAGEGVNGHNDYWPHPAVRAAVAVYEASATGAPGGARA